MQNIFNKQPGASCSLILFQFIEPTIPSPVPVSPQHQPHGQFVFIPNQQPPTSPFSPPPQATPQVISICLVR